MNKYSVIKDLARGEYQYFSSSRRAARTRVGILSNPKVPYNWSAITYFLFPSNIVMQMQVADWTSRSTRTLPYQDRYPSYHTISCSTLPAPGALIKSKSSSGKLEKVRCPSRTSYGVKTLCSFRAHYLVLRVSQINFEVEEKNMLI